MKRQPILLIAVLGIAVIAAGTWYVLARGKEAAAPAAGAAEKERKILYWTDPMIPGFKSDKPGKSPMGMDMVPVYADDAVSDGAAVTIRPEIIQNLGMRTFEVKRGSPPRRVVVTGYLFRDDGGFAVLADLFDRDAAVVRLGQAVDLRFPDAPGRVYHGTVERLRSDVDIGARTFRARIRLTRADAALQPNMLAEATIQATAPGKSSLYIPREALIRTSTRNAVVLALGSGRFQPVEVVPGVETDDWVEIRQGVKEGDTVVTSGQFLIDSEASVRASLERLEPADAAPSPAPVAPHTGH